MERRFKANQLVSVGLPVYNGENFLRSSIDSILGQSLTDLELIISDNGSSDGTQEICEAAASSDSRVKYLRHDNNLGAAWNYNTTFQHATGCYFKWAAHDDVCDPLYLERAFEVLESNQELALCYARTKIINDCGLVVGEYSDGLHITDPLPQERLRRYMKANFLRKTGMCNPIFGLIRASALRQTSLIRPFIASDQSLLAQLAIVGGFWELEEPLFMRRVHAGISTFVNRDSNSLREWFDPEERKRIRVRLFPARKNWIAVRYRQVKDIADSIGGMNLDERQRRACYLELIQLMMTDPKWLYTDLKYTLGRSPTPTEIRSTLFNK